MGAKLCGVNLPPAQLTVTHSSTVIEDQIDDLGHMNVRYYGMNAMSATRSMCQQMGFDEPKLRSAYTRHHHEQMLGNQLEVRSGLIGGSDRFYMRLQEARAHRSRPERDRPHRG